MLQAEVANDGGSPTDSPVDELQALKLQQLVEVQRLKRSWLQQHRLYFYRPRGRQAAFHASTARIRMAVGSNRSGKTTAGVAEDVSLCLGFRPWMLPADLKELPIEDLMKLHEQGKLPLACLTKRKVPFKLLIIEDDWDVADEILLTGTDASPAKLRQYLPAGALVGGSLDKQEKNGMGYICKIRLTNGSSITIDTEKSFINDRGSFEGKQYDGCHFDEPKNRDLRVAVKRGLVDTDGLEIFTLTPIAEPWMFDELHSKAAIGSQIEEFFFDSQVLVEEGVISKEGWQSFIDSLTEDEKEARIKGKWTHLKGLVYKEFDPRPYAEGGNIVEPVEAKWIAENATVWAHIDPHPRIPMAALLMAADKHGRLLLWEEVFAKVLIRDFVDLINSKLAYEGSGKSPEMLEVLRWIIDPLAWEEDPVDGHKWADEFMDLGIIAEKAPKRKEQGIMKVRKLFKERKLLVCRNCTRTIFELQHYVYNEWRSQAPRNEKETPVDKDDHMMESMYRLCLLDPVYVPKDLYIKPIEARSQCP